MTYFKALLFTLTIALFPSTSSAFNAWADEDCRKTDGRITGIKGLLSDRGKYGRKINNIEKRMKGDAVLGIAPETPSPEDLREATLIIDFLESQREYITNNYHEKCKKLYSASDKNYGYEPVKESIPKAINLMKAWVDSADSVATNQQKLDAALPIFTQKDKDKYSTLFEELGYAINALDINNHELIEISQTPFHKNPDKGWKQDLFVKMANSRLSNIDFISAFHKLASTQEAQNKYRGSCEMNRFDFYCKSYEWATQIYITWANKVLERDYKSIVDIPGPQQVLDTRQKLVDEAINAEAARYAAEQQQALQEYNEYKKADLQEADRAAAEAGIDNMFVRKVTFRELVDAVVARTIDNGDIGKGVVIVHNDDTYQVAQVIDSFALLLDSSETLEKLPVQVILKRDSYVLEGDQAGKIGQVFKYLGIGSYTNSLGAKKQTVALELIK
ncbi:hypothetical protein KOI40_01845 [Aestuariicella sp. G3-2]|uniref:hypothetical protein n=1 Tax=Pseudomaricurvus albidus TaxID=2842452 RepID=UPI001C0E6431|nr:hypothetical protein [Aestuariicella albida]MBU3068539.1 hypothetical protein [Aestuariicella albida]